MTAAPLPDVLTPWEQKDAVARVLLERTRGVLDGMQEWQDTIGKACRAYGFQTFLQASDWFQTVPKVDPGTRGLREAWLREQRAIATRKPAVPDPIPAARQLEIAIAALEYQEAQGMQEPQRVADIRRLHGYAYTDGEIAERLGVSDQTVFRHRKALGLPPNSDGGNRRNLSAPATTPHRKDAA